MSTEVDTIQFSRPVPVTIDSLAADLTRLGLRPGLTVIVHTSLSKLGWVCGGAQAVILALDKVLGDTGNLVMPTHCSGNSDPSLWQQPPVPETWWQTIRDTMPAYDKHLTPTRNMGAVAELFRQQPGVLRSDHPQQPFAARGLQAEFITADHALGECFGDRSPLARIYDLEGYVLLLGVGHANNTSLHLAETWADFSSKVWIEEGAAMMVDGQRQWVVFDEIDGETDDFEQIGAEFGRDTGLQASGSVGIGRALFMPQVALVDYAMDWMEQHRP